MAWTEYRYWYDGTFAGFLTCVFESYARRERPMVFAGPEEVRLTLYPERIIQTQKEQALRVYQGIAKNISPAAQRLAPLRGRISLLLPRLAAALLPALCAGVLALTAAENPRAVGALVPYLLFWAAVALVLALRRTAWGVLPVLMPFVPVLGVLLSPVLLDLSTLFPPWLRSFAGTPSPSSSGPATDPGRMGCF